MHGQVQDQESEWSEDVDELDYRDLDGTDASLNDRRSRGHRARLNQYPESMFQHSDGEDSPSSSGSDDVGGFFSTGCRAFVPNQGSSDLAWETGVFMFGHMRSSADFAEPDVTVPKNPSRRPKRRVPRSRSTGDMEPGPSLDRNISPSKSLPSREFAKMLPPDLNADEQVASVQSQGGLASPRDAQPIVQRAFETELPEVYACGLCTQEFTTFEALNRHRRMVHGEALMATESGAFESRAVVLGRAGSNA